MAESPTPDSGEQFPCASLAEALPHLRRPPGAAAVRFKIQNAADDAAQVAAYVDARLVYDRLDQVCGEQWWARFAPLPRALVPRPARGAGEPPPLYARCRLTLYGISREDVGEGHDPKSTLSDAVKRAAVTFGVGRSLYAMRLPWLKAGDADGELRRNGQGELVLDERTEAWCREKYVRWLEERGSAQFGTPLESGVERTVRETPGQHAGAAEASKQAASAPIRAAA